MQSTIFLDTQSPIFTIATAAASGALSYIITDYAGTTITKGQIVVNSKQTQLSLQHLPDNHYALIVTDHTTATPTTRTIPFSVLSPFTPPATTPFGVSGHFSMYDPLDVIQTVTSMGARSVRDDATWAKIEITPDTYRFDQIDPFMQEFRQNNLDPLLILDYNNPLYDNNQTPYDEIGFTAFAHYAGALVSHYNPQLKAVEVYNEYNAKFSDGPCAHNASCYAQMLRSTYQAIKAVRPDVTVVVGATFGIDLDWFKELFEAGALAYTDVISFHPYSDIFIDPPEIREIVENIQKLQTLIKAYNHGNTKPLWITELGWSTALNITDDARQAHYLVRSVVLSLSAGVQKFFWYDFLNDGTESVNLEQNFGLLRKPDAMGYYTPKLAYTAYAVLIRELANRSYIGTVAAAPGAYHIRFSDNLHVLWSIPFDQNIVLSTTGPVTVTSIAGKKQILPPTEGHITLKLSAEPIYIQGDIHQ